MKFVLKSKFKPTGDQPQAIEKLSSNVKKGVKHQTLLGVTGSGKTFSVANVIEKIQKPTLVIAHNKTLAAQLADEFREFFPDNAVHYFVSYYDYYQPEAYIPSTDTYIEKDSSINDEIDRLRHAATHALLTRKDVIIVASVSCIYGIGSPQLYKSQNFTLEVGKNIERDKFLSHLVAQQYTRNDFEIKRGTFRLKGDILEIFPAYSNNPVKVEFFGDKVEKISEIDWITGNRIKDFDSYEVFPATHFVIPESSHKRAIEQIRIDLIERIKLFESRGKLLEAQRIKERTNYDLEMIELTGYCKGIENYSRYFDDRKPGESPNVLLDFFQDDYLLAVDESHMTIPQIAGMHAGDLSRKEKLVEFGFRLPSAYDNRPLRFEEFYRKINQVIFTSATPAKYEIDKSSYDNIVCDKRQKYDAVIEQLVRPTGILDPEIEIRKPDGQIDNLITEIEKAVTRSERAIVTTLTKKMSEELTDFLKDKNLKVAYLHSDIDTLERSKILHSLRLGEYDVLVGINLLREGIDLPEVSLIAILDADKEGFLRSKTALIQITGRAARHTKGKVIMYADKITSAMQAAINETKRRREYQEKYNRENNITPKNISKGVKPKIDETEMRLEKVDAEFKKLPKPEKKKILSNLTQAMNLAAKNLEFERAAEIRDEIAFLEDIISKSPY
jgi:excinuclease ABC subunit B